MVIPAISAEDGEELRRCAASEAMRLQDECSALTVLLSEEGPQLVDQGLVTPSALGFIVVLGVEVLDYGQVLLGDPLQHLRPPPVQVPYSATFELHFHRSYP